MANPPNIRIRGIRSPIPQGYVLGRTSSGQGDVELIDIVSLGRQIATSSGSSTSGSAVLPVSGVTAGSYRCTNLTVTDKGIITAASDGDTDVFWLILQTAAATSLGGLESVTFLDNIDCGSLSGVGDTSTAGFSTVDLGGMV